MMLSFTIRHQYQCGGEPLFGYQKQIVHRRVLVVRLAVPEELAHAQPGQPGFYFVRVHSPAPNDFCGYQAYTLLHRHVVSRVRLARGTQEQDTFSSGHRSTLQNNLRRQRSFCEPMCYRSLLS